MKRNVVLKSDIHELETEIEWRLTKGWKLRGDIHHITDGKNNFLGQLIVKSEKRLSSRVSVCQPASW